MVQSNLFAIICETGDKRLVIPTSYIKLFILVISFLFREEDIQVIPIRNIKHKCVFMDFKGGDCVFVGHFPNFTESD